MRFCLLILFLCLTAVAKSQTRADSLAAKDSSLPNYSVHFNDSLRLDSLRADSLQADSLSRIPPPVRDTLRPSLLYPFASDSFLLHKRLFFTFTDPVRYTVSEKKQEGKEAVFYAIMGLLLLFALVKSAFPRYLPDLYSAYFRTTVRQKQIKEQLVQSPLPSLCFNVFFVLSGAVFVSLLVEKMGYAANLPFGLLVLYAAAALVAIYGAKFLLLKFFGWVLQLSEATDTYLFVVFSTNKIMGIFLLPFIVLLPFTSGDANMAVLTIGIIVVVALFAYRFFLAFISVNHLVQLNFFHFLLYLAAFEVLPLLLINKLLFGFLREIT